MKNICLLFFIVCPFFSIGQNWQLFNLNQKSYYSTIYNNSTIVESFNADSLKVNTDKSTLYFNKKVGLSDECYNSVLENIGYETNPDIFDSLQIIDNNFLFISDYMISEVDTLEFLPYAEVGESWYTTNNKIQLTCTSKELSDLWGVSDSIKTFKITSGSFNEIEFILSKSFGLVKFIPFWRFTSLNEVNDAEYYNLVGFNINNSKTGYCQPDFNDYFHLHAGDVLYWKEHDYVYKTNFIDYYYIDSLIEAFISLDSIYYKFLRIEIDSNCNLINTSEYQQIYLKERYETIFNAPTSSFSYFWDSGPTQSIDYTGALAVSFSDNDTITSQSFFFSNYSIDTENCNLYAWESSSFKSYNTQVGLYYSSWFLWSISLQGSTINGVTEGTAYCVSIPENHQTNNFSIYPNPSKGTYFVKSENEIQNISVYNIFGQNILNIENSNYFDLSNLSNGLYIIKLNTSDGILIQRVVKE